MGPRSADRGIGQVVDLVPVKQGGASMGPRSADRGIASEGDRTDRRGERLQWGRDQLIAEFAVARERYPRADVLQWGRDQLIAELCFHCGFETIHREASMGPRSADRGIERAPQSKPWRSLASMGPRSADRGIDGACHTPSAGGSGFNGAAIS